MALKTYRPTTPSLRQLVLVDRSNLWKGGPVKQLVEGKSKTGGRNNYGRITTRHIGGGHKQSYRLVDFKRRKFDIVAKVERLEYDPNRTAFIALIQYEDGQQSYILAPQRLAVGDSVVAGTKVDVKPGNAMPLAAMPIGTIVHNVEIKPGRGGQMARAAGSYVQLVGRDAGWAILRMNSGETRRVRAECLATVGAVSNPDNSNQVIGKAGRNRWKGNRPTVRSIAMNPVDHPNGGRTKGGKHWATPWGKPTKGYKTRKNKSTDKYIIRSRAKAKSARELKVRETNRVTLSLERPVRRRLHLEESRQDARIGPQRHHQDLEPPLHHPAAVRRPHVRGLQRSQAHSRGGQRGHDRPQVRRVRPDPYLHGARRRQKGRQEDLKEPSWASRSVNAASLTTRPKR